MSEPQYGPPTGSPIRLPVQPVKKKVWPWFLLGGLFLALLTLGGCIFVGYRVFKSSAGTGTVFAAALEQEEYQLAYDSLCAKSQNKISLDEFEENYVPEQEITKVEPVTVSLVSDSETDVFVVSFVLADGSRELVEYPMIKEDGQWRVCDPPRFS